MKRKKQKEVYLYCVKLHKEKQELQIWEDKQERISNYNSNQFLKRKKKSNHYFTCVKIDHQHHTIATWHEVNKGEDTGHKKK